MSLELHEKLNAYLIDNCLNKSAIARAINVEPKNYNSSLNGRRELRATELLDTCRFLGITCDELLEYEPPANVLESIRNKKRKQEK